MTIKTGDKIKVHIFGMDQKEIRTRMYDKVFEVHDQDGVLGIDWNCFAPLDSFSTENGAVVFERI